MNNSMSTVKNTKQIQYDYGIWILRKKIYGNIDMNE